MDPNFQPDIQAPSTTDSASTPLHQGSFPGSCPSLPKMEGNSPDLPLGGSSHES